MRIPSRSLVELLRRIHSDEQGTLSVITLLVMLGFVLMIGTLFNCLIVVQDKLELQNAADASAQSAGTQMARGLNAVTAANHIIGELQACVVLHHALAGDERNTLGEMVRNSHVSNQTIKSAYLLAVQQSVGTTPPLEKALDLTIQPATDASAIGDSFEQLRKVLTYAYRVHAVGAFLETKVSRIPYVGIIAQIWGKLLVTGASVYETKVAQEASALDLLYAIMYESLQPARKTTEGLIALTYDVSQMHAADAPVQAERVVRTISEALQTEGSLFPGLTVNPSHPLLQLPVWSEPREFPEQAIPRSQLVRASVPWIHYWRLPFLKFGGQALRLSRFQSYFVERTQEYSLKLAQREKERGINLMILQDFDPITMTKGNEVWTSAEGSRHCDERFGLISFARRPAPLRMGAAYFETPNQRGIAAYAQTLTYNANPQTAQATPSGRQKIVGWDTLNWDQLVPEWSAGNDPVPHGNTRYEYFQERAPKPEVNLNWQSLLTPTSRIAESVAWQQGDLGDILRRTKVETGWSRAH